MTFLGSRFASERPNVKRGAQMLTAIAQNSYKVSSRDNSLVIMTGQKDHRQTLFHCIPMPSLLFSRFVFSLGYLDFSHTSTSNVTRLLLVRSPQLSDTYSPQLLWMLTEFQKLDGYTQHGLHAETIDNFYNALPLPFSERS